jgi:cytoskeletal protein RodZ
MVPDGFSTKTIKPSLTVGQRLKAARKKREFTLARAEQLTKVKIKYLKALEEDRHDLLPTEVYSLGFLRCYGEALGLQTKKLLEQYRGERGAFKSARTTEKQILAPARRISGPRFLVTPRTLLALGSTVLVLGLVAYIAFGVRSFLAPPKLVIDKPAPESRVTSEMVLVSGETEPASTVTINAEVITVDSTGRFEQNIAVIPGLNTLEFVSRNRVGKESREVRKVLADYQIVQEPIPAPTVTPSPAISGSASPSTTSSPSATTSSSPSVSPTQSP